MKAPIVYKHATETRKLANIWEQPLIRRTLIGTGIGATVGGVGNAALGSKEQGSTAKRFGRGAAIGGALGAIGGAGYHYLKGVPKSIPLKGQEGGETLGIINDHFKDYYNKVLVQNKRSYNLMYGLNDPYDVNMPNPKRHTDLRDLGLSYEQAKGYGYPHLANLLGAKAEDWNMNMADVHRQLSDISEKSVIDDILSRHKTTLRPEQMQDLLAKADKLSDIKPSIRDMVGKWQ